MNTSEFSPLAEYAADEHKTPRREFLVQAASMLGLTVSAGAVITLVNACETTIIKSSDSTTTGGTTSGTTGGGTTGGTTSGNVINIAQEAALQRTGGAVIKTINSNPLVIMRTSDTGFLVLTAVCTHEGCTVELPSSNGVIQCLCHGSQFSASDGRVLMGPAGGRLKSYDATFDKTANTLTISI